MNPLSSLDDIIQWQSGLFDREVNKQLRFSLKQMNILPHQAAYIVDCQQGTIIESTSGFNHLFGYEQLQLKTVEELYEPICGSDASSTLAYTHAVLDWIFKNQDVPAFENSAQFKYRIRRKNGKLINVLRQTTACGKSNGLVTHTLGILTDISSFNNSSKVHAQVYGPYASFFDPQVPEVLQLQSMVSSREVEIIRCIARGMTSREIGALLHLSRHTVDTHRRNIIRKLELRNSRELLLLAAELGF